MTATLPRPAALTTGPRAVLTITGQNRPGLVEQLFAVLARPDACAPTVELVDLSQVVMHGRLLLALVLASPSAEEDALLAHAVRLASEVSTTAGVQVEVDVAASGASTSGDDVRARVTVLGRPVPFGAVAGVLSAISATGGVVEAIWSGAGEPPTALEFVVARTPRAALCAQLAAVADATGADIAIEQEGPAAGTPPPGRTGRA
jgi:phosphoserine phosphatase